MRIGLAGLRALAPVGALVAVAAFLVGCSGGGDAEERLQALEKKLQENQERDDRQETDMRLQQKRVADLDIVVQQHDKTLPKIEEDLRSRIKEMVAQETGGRRAWGPPPRPEIEPKFEVKPYLGFDAQDLLPDVAEQLKLKVKTGVLVTDVRPGSPAAEAGMAKNDIVQRFDGQEIKDFKDLKNAFAGKKPGDEVTLNVLRGDKEMEFKVKLGAKKVRVG
jgi:C-terminal processing protease CtpA/Prc